MDWTSYVLGAAILAAVAILASGFTGWPFAPMWLDSIGVFPMYVAAGVLAVLLVVLVDQVRRRT